MSGLRGGGIGQLAAFTAAARWPEKSTDRVRKIAERWARRFAPPAPEEDR